MFTLNGPLIPFFLFFARRMKRGHEETSTSQAGRKRGTLWETPIIRSLVATMSIEELRSFNQVPTDIRLEVAEGPTAPNIRGGGGGGADNVIYFTREQFAARLCFLIPYLVKQFLHFTRVPPVLVHLNVFRIPMGCSVLNLLYQLDISLIEICFIYTLKLGIGGRLSMSAHSPRLQFVTGLLNSLKTEAKWVFLVEGLL